MNAVDDVVDRAIVQGPVHRPERQQRPVGKHDVPHVKARYGEKVANSPRTKAAEILGVDRKTLREKLKRQGLG